MKAVAQGLLGGIKSFFGFAEGGMIQAAMGGWISGPQSGYPVSLDGGATTAFIGHGTEWVGMKDLQAVVHSLCRHTATRRIWSNISEMG